MTHFILFQNDATSTELTSFYQNNDTPLVGQMTPANKDRRYQGRPLLVAYYDVDWSFDHRVRKCCHYTLLSKLREKFE